MQPEPAGPPKTRPASVNTYFTDAFLMSTTTGMISVLGVSSARSVIFHAHLLDQLTDPEKFHNALSSVLKQGTEVVEKVIVSDLYRRLGLSLGDDHMEFVDAVTFAIEMTRNKPEAKILA